MKKHNFTQMAILGMVGGILLTGQAAVHADAIESTETHIAGNGCQTCGNKRSQNTHTQPDSMIGDSDKQLMNDMSRKPTTDTSAPMKENDFLLQLNEDGKKTYQSLDAEGKAMALKLAAQQNPNNAVKTAAKQMADRKARAPSGNVR